MRTGVRKLQETADKAVLIRCRYCDIRDTCSKRAQKEKAENKGIVTRCTLTPNRPSKKKRK